jgi:hypothetical protein
MVHEMVVLREKEEERGRKMLETTRALSEDLKGRGNLLLVGRPTTAQTDLFFYKLSNYSLFWVLQGKKVKTRG